MDMRNTADKGPYDSHAVPCCQTQRKDACSAVQPFDPSDGVQRKCKSRGTLVERNEAQEWRQQR
jgi:hypothetical protein